MQGLSGKNTAIVNNNGNGWHDIDVTWQPRRVDWNVHAYYVYWNFHCTSQWGL